MEDRQIIELFLERSERAVAELSARYQRLLFSIARNVLGNEEDAAECVNDTYLGVWNAIPPHQPENLTAFVCRIAKNLSLKRLRSRRTVKRGGFYEVSLPGGTGGGPASASGTDGWGGAEGGRGTGPGDRYFSGRSGTGGQDFVRAAVLVRGLG